MTGAAPVQRPDSAALLRYQAMLFATLDACPLVFYEKSRRIGATWGVAAYAGLLSSTAGRNGMDTLYIGFNLDMAREFIDACADWLRVFHQVAATIGEEMLEDMDEHGNSRAIKAFRIDLPSGHKIVALTSKPRSLRGRQGFLIFDEAAYHDQLEEMLKAGTAFLIWGGKLLVISTHDGVDNPFNVAVRRAESGGYGRARVLKTTFREAVADGLYRRKCEKDSLEWSQEAEDAWVADIYAFYGDVAEEELDVIPARGSGVYLTRETIEQCMTLDDPVIRFDAPQNFEQYDEAVIETVLDAWWQEHVQPALDRLLPRRPCYIGQDFARVGDLTVIAIGQRSLTLTMNVPIVIELRGMPFDEQERIMQRLVRALPAFGGMALDAGGNGAALAEKMQRLFGVAHVQAIKASEAWYLRTFPKLKAALEARRITLVRDEAIVLDLRQVKLVKGVPKIPERRAVKGEKVGRSYRHGDAAIALNNLLAAAGTDAEPVDYRASETRRTAPQAFARADKRRRGRAEIGFGVVLSSRDMEL